MALTQFLRNHSNNFLPRIYIIARQKSNFYSSEKEGEVLEKFFKVLDTVFIQSGSFRLLLIFFMEI